MTSFRLWSAHALRVMVAAAVPTVINYAHEIAHDIIKGAGDFAKELLVSGIVDAMKEHVAAVKDFF